MISSISTQIILSYDFENFDIQYTACTPARKNIGSLKKIGGDFDIICLQEVNHSEDRVMARKLISGVLEKYKSIYYEHPSFGNYVGFCTFWNEDKLNLISSSNMLLSEFKDKSPIHHRLIMSSKDSRRGVLITDFITKSGIRMRVTNLHLDWRGHASHRIKQLSYIKDFNKTLAKVDFAIVCGDFNTIGPIKLFGKKLYKKRQNLIQQTLGSDYEITLPEEDWTQDGLTSIESKLTFSKIQKMLSKMGMHYYQKLDYIFTKGFKVIHSEVLRIEGSDHYPVTAKLKHE